MNENFSQPSKRNKYSGISEYCGFSIGLVLSSVSLVLIHDPTERCSLNAFEFMYSLRIHSSFAFRLSAQRRATFGDPVFDRLRSTQL